MALEVDDRLVAPLLTDVQRIDDHLRLCRHVPMPERRRLLEDAVVYLGALSHQAGPDTWPGRQLAAIRSDISSYLLAADGLESAAAPIDRAGDLLARGARLACLAAGMLIDDLRAALTLADNDGTAVS
jgi:hypothetical protein